MANARYHTKALKTKGIKGAISSSYSVCDSWPSQEVVVALSAGTPTASMAAGVMKRSMTCPPTLARTSPMGTFLKAGTLSLRWKAV